MAYDNELRGALFRNDERRGDKDPIYKGTITIRGEEYWLSAWLNESKSGQKYMALKATPKMAREHSANRSKPEPKPEQSDEFNDDTPF